VPQVRSLPDSDLPLDSSSDDGNNDDDDNDDDDTNTHALHQHFHSKRGGCEFPFLLMATRETVTAVMMTMTKMTTTTRMTWTMFPKLPYPHWLQVVTPSLLLLAP
jgi:hypothetical protein